MNAGMVFTALLLPRPLSSMAAAVVVDDSDMLPTVLLFLLLLNPGKFLAWVRMPTAVDAWSRLNGVAEDDGGARSCLVAAVGRLALDAAARWLCSEVPPAERPA